MIILIIVINSMRTHMDNFQLYRTNTSLSGQVKWNINVESINSDNKNILCVNDFYISPVSDFIPYNRVPKTDMLNYSHVENLKSYYKQIENSFYKSFANPLLKYDVPLVVDDDQTMSARIDLHDDTLDMGAKRSQYLKTKKQFEFFCPIWIESLNDDDVLSFKFIWKTNNKLQEIFQKELISKTLQFNASELAPAIHNQFVKYFNQYVDDCGLRAGNNMGSELLSIDLDKYQAYISGISVIDGANIKSKQINKLAEDLVNTERLLMDFDNIILSNFEHQHMIARQIINFNFLFDIDDFVSQRVLEGMLGEDFNIDVQVSINGKVLPRKDFYTNYEYIYRKPINKSIGGDKYNVLDIIKDHFNTSIMSKNKITQNIFHWSLYGNPEYIFNLYTGFGGYTEDSQKHINISPYNYQDSPNIWTSTYNKNEGNINWCESIVLSNLTEYQDFKSNLQLYNSGQKPCTTIGSEWSGNVKYNKIFNGDKLIIVINKDTNISQGIEYLAGENVKSIQWPVEPTGLTGNIYMLNLGSQLRCIICDSKNLSAITFANMIKLVNSDKIKIDGDDWKWISDLKEWMNSVVDPCIVNIPLLGYMRAEGPIKEVAEVEHVKVADSKNKIIRYYGKLKPCFIDVMSNSETQKKYYTELFNYIYFKKDIKKSDVSDSPYIQYIKSGFPPVYKSIGYYPLDRYVVTKDDKDNIQLATEDEKDHVLTIIEDLNMPYEYKLYGDNNVLLLSTSINFNIICKPEELDAKVLQKIIDYYQTDEEKANYILKQYIRKIDWEYETPYDIKTYNYNLKLTLK